MIIQEVVAALANAVNPVVKVLIKDGISKVIALGFKKGMILKEHKTGTSTWLFVIDGQINYISAGSTVSLDRFEYLDIPVNEPHSVEALADSICILIKG